MIAFDEQAATALRQTKQDMSDINGWCQHAIENSDREARRAAELAPRAQH